MVKVGYGLIKRYRISGSHRPREEFTPSCKDFTGSSLLGAYEKYWVQRRRREKAFLGYDPARGRSLHCKKSQKTSRIILSSKQNLKKLGEGRLGGSVGQHLTLGFRLRS